METGEHNSNQTWNGNHSKKQVRRIEVKAITFLSNESSEHVQLLAKKEEAAEQVAKR